MIIKEITDEFVEVFGKPENRSGPMWELMKMGTPLPDGVDPEDPRVKAILASDAERCADCGTEGEPGAALCRICWRCDHHCRC